MIKIKKHKIEGTYIKSWLVFPFSFLTSALLSLCISSHVVFSCLFLHICIVFFLLLQCLFSWSFLANALPSAISCFLMVSSRFFLDSCFGQFSAFFVLSFLFLFLQPSSFDLYFVRYLWFRYSSSSFNYFLLFSHVFPFHYFFSVSFLCFLFLLVLGLYFFQSIFIYWNVSSCLNQYSFDVSTSSSFALFNSYLFAFSCIMFALTLLFWKF